MRYINSGRADGHTGHGDPLGLGLGLGLGLRLGLVMSTQDMGIIFTVITVIVLIVLIVIYYMGIIFTVINWKQQITKPCHSFTKLR